MLITVLVVLLIALFLTAVILLIFYLRGQDESTAQGSVDKKRMYNRDGIDLKNNSTGEAKGQYFRGANINYETFLVQPNSGKQYSPRRMIWHITLTDIDNNQQYSASFQNALYLGRADDTTGQQKLIFPNDSRISRTHCVILEFSGELYLQDCGSTNYTYLDGQRITGTQKLTQNSVISIGNTRLRVVFGA